MNILLQKDRKHLARLGAFAGQHPAMLLTLCYLLVSFLGLSFSWAFYARFGIDYFDYAEIGDFILAAFREPLTFLLALSSLAIGIGLLVFQALVSNFYERYRERSKLIAMLANFDNRLNRWGTLPIIIILFFIYCVLFISNHAAAKANAIRDGEGEIVSMHYADPLADGALGENAVMLGSSTRVVFLYALDSQRVRIVPMDAIVAIEKLQAADTNHLDTPETKPDSEQTETAENKS